MSIDIGILSFTSGTVVFGAQAGVLWGEVENALADDGSLFPVDAPSTVWLLSGDAVKGAVWAGIGYVREVTGGTDTGWRRESVRAEITGDASTDGQHWIPSDAPKTITGGDGALTMTATWDGTRFQRIFTSSTHSDTGWVKQ